MVYVLYAYTPSKNVALAAAALFGLSATYHLITMLRKKTYFYTAMVVGGYSKSSIKLLLLSNGPILIHGPSDDCRLCRPISLSKRYCKHNALLYAISPHYPSTFSLRSNYLHDIRPYRLIRQCTICIHYLS